MKIDLGHSKSEALSKWIECAKDSRIKGDTWKYVAQKIIEQEDNKPLSKEDSNKIWLRLFQRSGM
jgi:hypothetical protein